MKIKSSAAKEGYEHILSTATCCREWPIVVLSTAPPPWGTVMHNVGHCGLCGKVPT